MFGIESAFGMHFVGNKLAELKGLAELKALSRSGHRKFDLMVGDELITMHSRTFTSADQSAFEKLSGDNNPLHMDPVAARRFLFGRSVVHGIHLVLWALDDYLGVGAGPFALRSIKAQFLRPVGVDEAVCSSVVRKQNQCVELELISAGASSTRIQLQFEPQPAIAETALLSGFSESQSPRVIPEAEIASQYGRLNLLLDRELAATLFPHLTSCIPAVQIATLLATTRLVGRELPGLD